MKKANNVGILDFSDGFLMESVDKRYQEGDYYGALVLLNKRNSMYPPSADAAALAADIYEELGLYQLSADAWFRFLDTCNEADFAEGYEGLAIAFMNLHDDAQSAAYYRRFFREGGIDEVGDLLGEEEPTEPKLRLVRADDEEAPEVLSEGLALLKAGHISEARKVFSQISPASPDYPTAAGLLSMCSLLCNDEDAAEKESLALLEIYPDNVQALTTYCAVLGVRGNHEEAKQIAYKLAALPTESTDDIYRIATALCETGIDDLAYEKLTLLKEKLPYDENVLYFHAVACYHIDKLPEAIESLETLTTVYPRKAVAQYYLVRMRELQNGEGKRFQMTYYYRVPEEEYNTIATFFLSAQAMEDARELRKLSELPEVYEFFRLAFDERDGNDDKLQMIASKVAEKIHADDFLREVLLDYEGDDVVKLSILHDLTLRNEDDSFGTVICNVYKEFFTHKIEIGKRKKEEFLNAFADVYAKFALVDEDNERKICIAAEDVYATLEDAEAWDYFDERAELAVVIYREARIHKGERSFKKVVELFEANEFVAQEILNYMM